NLLTSPLTRVGEILEHRIRSSCGFIQLVRHSPDPRIFEALLAYPFWGLSLLEFLVRFPPTTVQARCMAHKLCDSSYRYQSTCATRTDAKKRSHEVSKLMDVWSQDRITRILTLLFTVPRNDERLIALFVRLLQRQNWKLQECMTWIK